MNDRLDTTTTFDASDADDRIDALARSAGSALRRPADPGRLARIHRAKRNHQIARATGGAAAVLAVVGGAVVLMNRGGEERLVPATVPSTVVVETLPTTTPVTVGSTVPTSAPSTTPVTSPATTPVTSPVTDPPVTTSPPVNTATGEQPQFLYVGTQTTGTDEQQVLDFATGDVIRTEPMEQDQSLTATPPRPAPRTTSAVNDIEYALDGLGTDGCGQRPVSVTGAESTLPERASLLQVSGDGRRVLTMSAPECPRPDELGPDEALFGTAVPHQQEIRLFDADDPSAAGVVLDTVTMRGYEGTLAEFSADGRFVVLSSLGVDGTDATSIVAYDLETGDAIVLDDGDCLLGAGFQRGPSAFVGEQSVVALTEKCDDGWHVEITSLYEADSALDWLVPGVTADEAVAVDVEVWEQSLTTVADATFTVSVSNGLDATGSRMLVRRPGGELEQLAEGGTIVSFLPIWDTVGS